MRFDLSDEEWALLVPLLPKNRNSARVDDRRILNAIFYGLRTGMPWRDLPERYGALHNSLQSVQPLVSPGHLEAHLRRVGIEISRQLVSDRQHDRESPPLSQRRKRGGEKSGDRHQPGRPDDENPRDRRQQRSAAELHRNRRTDPRQPGRRRRVEHASTTARRYR